MANALTNFELIDLIKDFKLDNHFGGVYSKDQLPELIKDKFYIINFVPTTSWIKSVKIGD